jgi:glycosyltransferase involved in cell wall biosynthesis
VHVSVVICTHTSDRFEDLVEAARSVQSGTHEDYELVLVSDGSERVSELMHEEFTDLIAAGTCTVELLRVNSGLLAARNRGAAAATGDVVAFLDDDAIAERDWLARLVEPYHTEGRRAVGGRVKPAWVAPGGKPEFLPEEFYWLVGVTHRGFGPGGGVDGVSTAGEVRNTNGSNLSFEAATFSKLEGFDTDIVGRKGGNHLQGGETELCARFGAEFDEGVWYVPDAEVAHKVFDYRTEIPWLLRRAFWQGYSKRALGTILPRSRGEERAFLVALLGQFLPKRVRELLSTPSVVRLKQLSFLIGATLVVGLGYLYGMLRWR